MIEVIEEISSGNETRSVQIETDVTVILKRGSVKDVEGFMIHLTMEVKRKDVAGSIRGRDLRRVSQGSDISSMTIGVRVREVTTSQKQIMMKSKKKSSYLV